MKKILKGFGLAFLVLLILILSYIGAYFPEIMTGMDAKVMCSCVFLQGRDPESVLRKELQVFPGLTWATIDVNRQDSTTSATLLWKTSKAIYRRGLGCTLLAEQLEQVVRNQKVRVADLQPPASLDTIAWPLGDKVSAERIAGIDYHRLNGVIDTAFAEPDPENPAHSHGVVVVYDGQIIAERYAAEFDYRKRQMGWSMTKSIANALIGILVKDGKLNLGEAGLLNEWKNDERNNITLNNLLQASSGLEWSESYFVPSSHFHQMFISSDDKARYAASLPLESKPGTVFEYSSGTTNILSRIMREKVGDNEYYEFPYRRLFHPLGMYSAILEPDASGTFVASSYGFASARDWARLGLLYLNDGIWNGKRILPEGWVQYSTTPAPAAPLQEYGAQIWLNRGKKENPAECFLPGVPNDAFLFEGFERNSVTIIPSKKLVVVRLGVTHNRSFVLPEFLKGIISSLPQQDSVVSN